MPFFILDSKGVLQDVDNIPYYMNLNLRESDLLAKCKAGSFFSSLVLCYFNFLYLKFSIFMNLTPVTPRVYREYLCINKYFKHILVVEWGFYDDSIIDENLPSEYFHLSTNLDFIRPYCIPEYECSDNDLVNPFYKKFYKLILYRKHIKPPYTKLSSRFFFNFFVLMPASISGYTDTSFFSFDFRTPKIPMQLQLPILFEFFFLKFNLCCFLFSTSLSNIYDYYSLSFLKTTIMRFCSILSILVNFYLNKILNYNNFSLPDLKIFFLKYSFSSLITFYSLSSFNSNYTLSSFFYFSVLSEYQKIKETSKGKFFNIILKNFLFILFLYYSYVSLLNITEDISLYMSLMYNFRLYFIFVCLLILIFIFLVRKFVGLISKFDFTFSYLAQFFCSSFLLLLPGLLSYIFLLRLIYNVGFHNLFYALIVSVLIFSLFSILLKFNRFFWLYFTKKHSIKKPFIKVLKSSPIFEFSNSILIFFFPILMIPFFFLFKILLGSFLFVCLLANLYMPDVSKRNSKQIYLEFNSFNNSNFKVPFYDIGYHGYSFSYDCATFELSNPPNELIMNKLLNQVDIKVNLEDSYFFKFLLDKNDKMWEHQYNYFEAKGVSFFNSSYKSFTRTKFPNKCLYFIIVLNVWAILFVINIKTIINFSLSFLDATNSFEFRSNGTISHLNQKIRPPAINPDFNVFNLFYTTYRNFDLFYKDN